MNDQKRFARVEELFDAARTRDGAARTRYLDRSRALEPAIVAEVERLLAHHDSDSGVLAEPIGSASFLCDSSPLSTPERIGRYRVLSQLGAGGMGVVYLAEQERPRREVAIKVIRPGLVTERSLRRFGAEAELLGRLKHPGVAQIYEAGAFDDGGGTRPYFAMEHVVGVPLIEYAERADLSHKGRLELFILICEAVQHAHQRGVIHRDLKPGNILVDETGFPKILDFGVALAVGSDRTEAGTLAGELIGTIGYMSPEQLGGEAHDVDTRADIHALGVVLYELLAGRLPYEFTGESLAGVICRIREDRPLPLGSVVPSLRGDLETICAKAIDKDKELRYPTAESLAADLRRHLDGEPVQAQQPTAIYLLRKFIRRNTAFTVAASVALVSISGLLIGITTAAIEVAHERDDAITAKEEADAANRFLGDVLSGLDPRETGSGVVTLEDLLDDMSELIGRGELVDQLRVEATVRGTLGIAYRTLGEYEQSKDHLEHMLAYLETHAEAPVTEIATCLGRLGVVYMVSGEYDRAESSLMRALDILDDSDQGPGSDLDRTGQLADACQNLAQLYTQQRRLDEAERLSLRAIALRRSGSAAEPAFLARSLNTLAVIRRLLGDADGATRAYLESLDSLSEIPGPPGLDEATTRSNLALLYMYQGMPEDAAPLLEECLRIRRSILPGDHPDIGQALNSLGGVRSLRGDIVGAADAYRESLRIREASLGDSHPDVATTMLNLGSMYSRMDMDAESVPLFERALRIRRAVYGPGHRRLGAAMEKLGGAYRTTGRTREAEMLLKEAVGIYETSLGPGGIEALRAGAARGSCLIALADYQEAESVLLRVYREYESLDGSHEQLVDLAESLCELYMSWNSADAGGVHDGSLTRWTAVLSNLREMKP